MLATAPFSLAPREAIRRLERCHLLQPYYAIECLSALQESAQILILYQHYFPDDYAASKRSPQLNFDAGCAYSPREIEFMELVDQRLFPLAHELATEVEERFWSIPLYSWAIEVNDLEELRPGIQALVGFAGTSEEEVKWDELLANEPPGTLPPLPWPDGDRVEFDQPAFEARCARLGKPLRKIAEALAVVTFSTDTLWLDYSDETLGQGSICFDWSIASIDGLSAEWQRATSLLADLESVAQWLEAKPGRLARLIAAWNRSFRPKKVEEIPSDTQEE